ncbi:hypothetical protein CONLIGDRAFT_681386 [Coniochaeta ligniaria NRRL 30616]|uniref:J domain-containing protein n=1 Tax=Coniochaeta ligniaria NRRL 30616 TaxID=1408157 RepID=A0A1J7JL63_9PEZI|nr:hypothetical protein CONLIGDRAFT_681386 [Coniochaeta ligniaria NRRL 30616]
MKADMGRDYYADLELPSNADINDIKKQFRKLALKYHPDRNPGREAEVNSKFQTIQSAHEILTNPEQKAKYDTHRSRTTSRYPTASGVRGNPWQNAGSNFPPPPRRPPMPTRPSAASRYTSWQTPEQKSPREDPNAAARAWDRMRPGSSRQSHYSTTTSGSASNTGSRRTPTRPMDPPPPPPRTDAQRKKAEASFGTRRTNFTQSVPDEPAAATSSYTTKRTNLFTQAAEAEKQKRKESDYIDPLSKQFQETFVDGRQRTPYSVHSGEKFNPFDGTNVNRGRSVRDNLRSGSISGNGSQPPSPPSRRRSASVPDEAEPMSSPGRSRAGHRYTPPEQTRPPASVFGDMNNQNASAANSNPLGNGSSSAKGKDGATVYGFPSHFRKSYSQMSNFEKCAKAQHANNDADAGGGRDWYHLSADFQDLLARVYPSGSAQAGTGEAESYEVKQARQLQDLINSKKRSHDPAKSSPDSSSGKPSPAKKRADHCATCSFGMTVDDDTFTPTSEQQRFMRKSADSINTRFVADNFSANDWQFNAGRSDEDAFVAAKKRAQRAARRGTSSPRKDGVNMSHETTSDPQLHSQTQTESGFDAAQWTEKIGPEAFVPRPPPRNASASPTKLNRPIKKAKPVRMTAGTAGLVDEDESSSSEDKTRPGTAMGSTDNAPPVTTDSPVAMDIDTPPPEPEKTTTEPKVARNIPVEPSKPEWRAGNVAGVGTAEATTPPDPNRMGSEDSSDFLFADFKNVAPFAPQPGGLASLGDLKSSLPFESKAAPRLAVEKEQSKPLSFPTCPKSPRPPTVLAVSNLKPSNDAWEKYVHEFHHYMEQWADFNARVTDHFNARKNLISESKKLTGFNWVEARGDAGLRKYLQWCEEDKIVRQKWMVAFPSPLNPDTRYDCSRTPKQHTRPRPVARQSSPTLSYAQHILRAKAAEAWRSEARSEALRRAWGYTEHQDPTADSSPLSRAALDMHRDENSARTEEAAVVDLEHSLGLDPLYSPLALAAAAEEKPSFGLLQPFTVDLSAAAAATSEEYRQPHTGSGDGARPPYKGVARKALLVIGLLCLWFCLLPSMRYRAGIRQGMVVRVVSS